MSSISWFYFDDLNSQAQLFQNIEEIDYIAVAFVCNCGQEHIALYHYQELPSYICPNCENSKFYNANRALHNFNLFLDSNTINIPVESAVDLNGEAITSYYYLKIPSKIDFLREKVHYTNKSIFSVSLSREGEEMFCYELDPLEETSMRGTIENIEE